MSRNGDLIVNSYGMGGEINLDLVEKMAEAGHGNIYDMRDADSAARAFAAQLGGLITTVAQDIKTTVESDDPRIEVARLACVELSASQSPTSLRPPVLKIEGDTTYATLTDDLTLMPF
ncbi:MAG: hypothetical protein V1792_02820 [Pseudomonadota bacterium]